MTTRSHHDNVEKQFGSQANAYLTSAVHASGRDLQRLGGKVVGISTGSRIGYGMRSRARQLCGRATRKAGRGL